MRATSAAKPKPDALEAARNPVEIAAEQRIVVTKDQDFVDSLLLAGEPERLLWVTTGNIRNDALIALFTANLATIEAAFTRGRYVELSATHVIVHL